MTFGERLRQLREERGMTLDEVANAVGLTRPTIYRYETGQIANVPPDRVHALANLFGVTRPFIMGWTDNRHVNPSENLDTVAERLRNTPEGEFVRENDSVYWRATGHNEADCTTAATQALRALIKFGISRTPIWPQHIIQHSKHVTVVTVGSVAEYDDLILNIKAYNSTRANNLFMVASYTNENGEEQYVFAIDREARTGDLKLAIAIEIGHIYLGHMALLRNRTRKIQESECFAVHLVFPRPVIQLLTERGYVFTKRSFSRIFGECDLCLNSILNSSPVTVSPELNRLVKEQFVPYVDTLDKLGVLRMPTYRDEVLDLSNYMAGYEE